VAGLKHTLASIPAGVTRRVYGVAHWDGSEWLADIDGSLLDAWWNTDLLPSQGASIAVDITKDEYGQATALVVCEYAAQPGRPSTGNVTTVIPAGVATEIVFTGEDGVSYTTDRFIGSYNPGDPVYLSWDAAKPTVLGKIGAVATPPPAAPAPAPAVTAATGKETLVATKSNTWGVGGWGRWAGSQSGGEDVYSGTWGGYTVTGAWFYGTARPALAGKTITSALFRLPNRLSVGASGSATVHLYAHTSSSQPSGDVSRTVGPFDVTVAANSGPKWVTLPSSFHSVLVNGGGISIAGDPYVGFASRLDDPESGKVQINWSV
jgi:hypothetical protein